MSSFWIQRQNTKEGTLRAVSRQRNQTRALKKLAQLAQDYPQDLFSLYPMGTCTNPIAVGYKKEVEIRGKIQ